MPQIIVPLNPQIPGNPPPYQYSINGISGPLNTPPTDSVFTNVSKVKDRPICIIANSIKGKGVSFMEDKVLWHYKSLELNQYKKALSEI